MAHSGAVYDAVAGALRRQPLDAALWRRASGASMPVWRRVLGFEGCATQLDRELRSRAPLAEIAAPVREMLRESTAASLRFGLIAHRQLAEIATLAGARGVRVMAVKGAAHLLGGQLPGARSMADIDLLAAPADGARFHAMMTRELGYTAMGPGYPHHLPVLARAGSLNVDLHVRLADVPTALDAAIWTATRVVRIDGHPLELPSPTSMVLHTLEHGLALNWMGRYRLRDILDLAALSASDVSGDLVRSYVAHSPERAACETLLSAAHELEPRLPSYRPDAWRTIRRVSRTRLALATVPRDPRVAERFFRYVGLAAEGSPRSIIRAGRSAVQRLATAWLPVRRTTGRTA